jgi:putative two-component system response regulator
MINNKQHVALIVDDEEQVLSLISTILKIQNIETVRAEDVQSSLEKIKSNENIDLAIVDYYLPDGTGEEVIRGLKEYRPNTPSIMISGKGEEKEIRLKSLVEGANAVLPKPFSDTELLMLVRNLIALAEANERLKDAENIIEALGRAMEVRDAYTEGHGKRVAEASIMIYDGLGLNDRDQRHNLYMGALLHDIGKIGIADSILKSPNKLTAEEYDAIKRHPEVGRDICKDLSGVRGSLDIILYHHERLDGSGYPKGLDDGEIPLLAQIVAIPDIFDAMTTKRTYRDAMGISDALDIMEDEASSGKINKEFFTIFKSHILKAQ